MAPREAADDPPQPGGPRPRRDLAVALAVALLAVQAAPVLALGPVAVPDGWGGTLGSRARLSGDWAGTRDALGAHGVVVDLDLRLAPRAVTGGGDDGSVGWGNAIYTLNIDTGRAGWWPGGFINVRGESAFGNAGRDEVGALLPTDTSTLLPRALEPDTGLESATITQFLSPRVGLTAGKIFTLDFTKTEFRGDYDTQFMNTALNVPMATALVPISAFGGGVLLLPGKGISVLALALDPSGSVMDNDLDAAFADGVMFLGGLSVETRFFARRGHHALTGAWGDKTYLSLAQAPSNIARMLLFQRFPRLGDPGSLLRRLLARRLPNLGVPVEPLAEATGTWSITYGFEQYLWQPAGDPARGVGLFFSVGASDGNPNPVESSLMLGLGGKGVIPGRPRDSFGIGWARSALSDDFVPFLRDRLALGLAHEDVFELYYNVALARWLGVTPGVQFVDSGLAQTLDDRGRLVGQDTTVVFSLRTFIRF